jgi:sugar phosphate isomerase/epimerase
MARTTRRGFLQSAPLAVGAAAVGAAEFAGLRNAAAVEPPARKAPASGVRYKIGLAAYSFRKFLDRKVAAPNRWTLSDFLEKAAEVGADGVELTEYYFEKPVAPATLSALKRKAHLLGLDIIGSPIGNVFTHPAGEARDQQIKHVADWLDVSADLGSPCVRIFAGNTPKGLTDEQARKNVVECIETLCPHAEKRGVMLALENHGGVVATAEGLLEIVKAVKCPWLGVNLDGGNFRTEDPYADLAKVAPYAITVQYKVEIFPGGRKPGVPADAERVAGILREAGYRGWVALEYESAEDPLVAVPKHLADMRKVF